MIAQVGKLPSSANHSVVVELLPLLAAFACLCICSLPLLRRRGVAMGCEPPSPLLGATPLRSRVGCEAAAAAAAVAWRQALLPALGDTLRRAAATASAAGAWPLLLLLLLPRCRVALPPAPSKWSACKLSIAQPRPAPSS